MWQTTLYYVLLHMHMTPKIPNNMLRQEERNTENNFHGYCMDSCASKTVRLKRCRWKQLHVYKKHIDIKITTRPSPHMIRFRNGTHQSTVWFIARAAINHGSLLAFKSYIVSTDLPFLISLDILHDFGLCIHFEGIDLKYKNQQWKI